MVIFHENWLYSTKKIIRFNAMCGINGVYNFGSNKALNLEELIPAMNKKMAHRGPDNSGLWGNDFIHLGHTRLSIIDLSATGNQPMTSSSGKCVITYNGEIYNYKVLGNLANDTLTVVDNYETNGKRFLKMLDGMFAFAIWDKTAEKLFLANDKYAKKPLYYTDQKGIFAFSSTIEALLELPWIKSELDKDALNQFLSFKFVSAPATLFKGIKKFHPGHTMTVSKNGIENYRSYYDKTYDTANGGRSEITEEGWSAKLMNDFDQAVSKRMLSDVPVGVFLSGGVDSSAVLALMRQKTKANINTYSIGFEGQENYDELKYAKEVAKMFGASHHERIVSAKEIQDFLPTVIDHFDDPLADATCIPIYFLSQMAREKGDKVILTGDGADELFLGYRNWLPYAQKYPLFNNLKKLPEWMRKLIYHGGKHFTTPKQREMLRRINNREEFFQPGVSTFKENERPKFLHPEFLKTSSSTYFIINNMRDKFHQSFDDDDNFLKWMSFSSFNLLHPNVYLYRMDRMGMANSIEIRTPFLDDRVVPLAFQIPDEMKIKNGVPKYILKKALESILPDSVLYRKKMGFCVPLQEWIVPIVLECLEQKFDAFNNKYKIFNSQYIHQQMSNAKNNKPVDSNELWIIYFLIKWCDRWIEKK
jgi:asparagine synthase (glutamine-hydrolysing)